MSTAAADTRRRGGVRRGLAAVTAYIEWGRVTGRRVGEGQGEGVARYWYGTPELRTGTLRTKSEGPCRCRRAGRR